MLVVKRDDWEIYLRYTLLIMLHDMEDHRYDDFDQVDHDFKSKKEHEVEVKKEVAKDAFESLYPGEYDSIQLTDEEDPEKLEERIEKVFADKFHGYNDDTYNVDDTIKEMIKKLIDGTPKP